MAGRGQPHPHSTALIREGGAIVPLHLSESGETGPRFAALDGLRGLAASYVVCHHAYYLCLDGTDNLPGVPPCAALPLKLLAYGRLAVDVFLVLSGFVLMTPVVRAADHRLRGGTLGFLCRRVRRIFPPYYAALLLTLALITFQPLALVRADGEATWGSIVAHGLMAHNLRPAWNRAMDAPMWSVATEWDVYLLFPLLLLPVWRRFGPAALLTLAAVVSIVPQTFGSPVLDWAAPWYVGLFAMGMIGAAACGSGPTTETPRTMRSRSALLATATVPLLLGCFALKGSVLAPHPLAYRMITDFLMGAIATFVIVFCATGRSPAGPMGQPVFGVERWLQSRGATGLGRISYSLYLTHWPLLALAHGWAGRLGLSQPTTLTLMLLVAAPTTVAFAYGFYRLFERPLLAGKGKRPRQTPAGRPAPAGVPGAGHGGRDLAIPPKPHQAAAVV